MAKSNCTLGFTMKSYFSRQHPRFQELEVQDKPENGRKKIRILALQPPGSSFVLEGHLNL